MHLTPVSLLALAALAMGHPMREANSATSPQAMAMSMDKASANSQMISSALEAKRKMAANMDMAKHPLVNKKHPLMNGAQQMKRHHPTSTPVIPSPTASPTTSPAASASVSVSVSGSATPTPTPPTSYGDYGAYGDYGGYANYGDYDPEVEGDVDGTA